MPWAQPLPVRIHALGTAPTSQNTCLGLSPYQSEYVPWAQPLPVRIHVLINLQDNLQEIRITGLRAVQG